jgi:hypothetical protein
MKLINAMLAFVAIAGLIGCSHQVSPAAGGPTATLQLRAASAEDDARAEQLVKAKLQADGITFVQLQLHPQAQAGSYLYDCTFSVPQNGLLCYYSAKGSVDLTSGKVTTRRSVQVCLKPRSEQ